MAPGEIKALRIRMGLSGTEFALRLGVTIDAVRKYEQGARRPTERVLLLLRALNASTPNRVRVSA